ncbi:MULTISPECIES: Stp1/IreP family PP2C-type Ser/Thr phosphatase [Halobacteriovorax]|uniref:Stp1/IreP family PP2C-type Ser/Thr phosphatase n=1 Tax=Halobacteriovorax vibrionivorans TaxID=2152716 RepID=A0ABY0IGR5_9BACT|nr:MULTISPECIES: Stp1/IreP family PP2C-type Ser/Thr phosphatase [Halobacteriovorax]AYF44481.1 phosphoprotein phosphatase [Halobacteriovorax sp. BALOs_7]RZF20542.1 Stp1/IreP family PP2C-type Ser/Thr phosphatase [Halobacteriovorax vibrionivorans]TGD47455.1 Stp1/IreP family PP2C-type Ser/Thr phosphatase [Halobacteriovorax sp. Y22]
MNTICAGVSDIGRKRETNQDSIYISNNTKLYIVADGMGGHSGGELASTMAIKYLAEKVKDKINSQPQEELGQVLQESVLYANNKIKAYADSEPALKGMGTTVVSLLFDDESAKIANVGDSRAYVISNGQIFQLTKDHSVIQEKINYGIYTRDQAAKDPNKNYLSRTVGFEEDIEVDIYDYRPQKGDIFLLCSDGLHGKLSDEDILFIIKDMIDNTDDVTHQKLHDCVQTLIRQANEHGGQDNISIILTVVN